MIQKNLLIDSDPNIENQSVLHINRLDARATIVPAQKRGVYYQNKYESSLIRTLNGDFKFRYLLGDTQKDFYRTDIDDSDWDTIDVPSMWQYRGYGKPEYPNIRYSIPFLPPYIKKQNPVGLYRKTLFVECPAERTILHFAGVDNAFYAYLNGEMIGFSKGSRMPAEFDVTKYVKKGENLLEMKIKIVYSNIKGAEYCYLLGDFGVAVEGSEAKIVEQTQTADFVCTNELKMPFFGGNIIYECRETVDEDSNLIVKIPEYRGALTRVYLDGDDKGYICFAPYTLDLGLVKKGEHTISFKLYGNRYNTFGSLHCKKVKIGELPAMWQPDPPAETHEYLLK